MNAPKTKAWLARQLGCSERNVHLIFRHGTTDRDIAAKVAKLWGGHPREYFRRPRQKGRKRDLVALLMKIGESEGFRFKNFIEEAETPKVEGDPVGDLIVELKLRYGKVLTPTPPDDFDSLESLIEFTRAAGLEMRDRDAALAVWQRFKVWRIETVAATAIFDIEC